MRIQRLQIGAFGPFADTVTLDFDALNDAGLFLLSGPNGAGKSSILDAVCFALYGQVPGDRGGAKRFRSDHARPGQAPIVEIEATFATGTYRIVRTAAWDRPRKRGEGTTSQQSTVSLSRRVGEGWEPVTTRLDEAGQLITRLVGMSFVQFCQVVILPQGRFQAFLRATADERRALLQQLFHTGRFQRVEAWLREHRLALGRLSREHHDGVRAVLDRISEVAEAPLPDGADDTADLAWVDGLLADLTADLGEHSTAVIEATALEAATRAALETGRDLATRIGRHRVALAQQASLVEVHDEVVRLRDSADAARRAAPVTALMPVARSRDEELTEAEARHGSAQGRLSDLLGEQPTDLDDVTTRLTEAASAFAALGPRVAEADRLRTDLAAGAVRIEEVTVRVAALSDSLDDDLIPRLGSVLAEIRAADARLPVVEADLAADRARVQAARLLVTLAVEHGEAAAEVRAATEVVLTARDTWLSVREARINGMAAELAGQLAVGADCPVCGSCDHPHPAATGPGAPDAAAEQAAHRAVDDAKAAEFAHSTRVHDLSSQIEQTQLRVGDRPVAELAAAVERGTTELRALKALTSSRASVEAELDSAERRRSEAHDEVQQLREGLAALTSRRDDAGTRLASIEAELAGALSPTPYAGLAEAVTEIRTRLDAAVGVREARSHLDRARSAQAEASGSLTTAALEAGFASAAEAGAAHLSPPRLHAATEDLRRHDARVAAVRALLADPDLAGLAGVDPPDEAGLRTRHADAVAALTTAAADRERSTHRRARLAVLRDDLSTGLDAWSPVRSRLELVTHLSSFCEGKAVDNRWQTQLSAYVVAWRLSQVADAANVRLAVMTHGRYSLEHTDERGSGQRRGGLTLVVRDDWTGVTRDPVTLSGGETFMVALALALGLADVITAEAGGATLQTLFVDEGFGSLDETSLDQVLDTLDSLRASGRTVGVVSHVAEMRSRIPVQLQVDKPSEGGPSTVRVRV